MKVEINISCISNVSLTPLTIVSGPLSSPNAPMGIGALCGEEFFTGLIDEVRILIYHNRNGYREDDRTNTNNH